ncbi:UDP-glucuronosyltransferase 2B19-like [Sitophilus oryzae]|uniref:UDP-glucuronosyltransferase 2B19-like n=1 Tax=Sitophilus oryzae TaxID=7048 RepID=A0A6J2YK25_SITOR|nr:UDP-glucuronosyltransferase 2B19-like [Sitophilus oryzae]
MISCKCIKDCNAACSCRKAGLHCSVVCGSCQGRACSNSEIILEDPGDDEEIDSRLEELMTNENIEDVELNKNQMNTLGGYYEAPLIGICSLGAATNGLDAIGNVLNPVVTPDQNVPIGRSNFSFRDRLLSIFYSIWIRIYYHWHILPMEDKTVRKYLGNNLPYLGQIERNVSLLLLNRNQISHRIMPVVPGVIEFGGLNYNRAVQTLNPDLQDFLDKSNNGVIYFSLGAAIKLVDFLSPDQVQIFKSVFNKLPYNVLWKFENDTMESKPENIFVSKWLNQSVVLGMAT